MKKIVLSIVAGLAIAIVPASSAYAWTYSLTGSGKCQADGSYKITWIVNNSTEPQALNITSSSNANVVPVGTKVPAKKSSLFTQVADGTKAGNFNLTLKGNWPSDQTIRSRSATVNLKEACAQPTPPVTPPAPTPEPGRGGGSVTPVVAPTPAPAPQVVAPKGAVDAGEGSKTINIASILGLGGSLVALGLGAHRLNKQDR